MVTPEQRGEAARAWTGSGVVTAPRIGFAGGDAGPGTTFTDGGGPVLSAVQLQLVFWGAAWNQSPDPTVDQVVSAVQTILASPYMLALSQYRNIGLGTLGGSSMITDSSPPNPFSDSDVRSFLEDQINSGGLPSPEGEPELLYVVVMPTGVTASGPFIGEHSFFIDGGRNVHYAWVTNSGLDPLTTIFSHELVESCSDPEGTAITGVAGTCSQTGWCEIGDVCQSTGTVCGITVQSYWSQKDESCVVPNAAASIAALAGDCTAVLVAGGQAEFSARLVGTPDWLDLSSLPQLSTLAYTWTASAGTIQGPADGQQLTLLLPGGTAALTVSVTITDGAGCQYQGDFHVRPVPPPVAEVQELLCEIRKYARVNLLVNPLWDPLPDPATVPVKGDDLRALDSALKALAEMSDRVMKEYESGLGGSD